MSYPTWGFLSRKLHWHELALVQHVWRVFSQLKTCLNYGSELPPKVEAVLEVVPLEPLFYPFVKYINTKLPSQVLASSAHE